MTKTKTNNRGRKTARTNRGGVDVQCLASRTRGTSECYYAVRIGDPRRHWPYFMLQEGANTPALFATKAEAEKFLPREASNRVVKVWLRDRSASDQAHVSQEAGKP